MTALVWFRQDLRLRDNPALHAATRRGEPVIPVYIWSPEDEGHWPLGGASRWWLHHSLQALDASLRERGSRLVLAQGAAPKVLLRLAKQTAATTVCWNRRYEPAARDCEAAAAKVLGKHGVHTESFNSALLAEPDTILNKSGQPYRVYTPYMRRMLHELRPSAPLDTPAKLFAPRRWPNGIALKALRLAPSIRWDAGLEKTWTPGEAGAHARIETFLCQKIGDYSRARERPAEHGTSGLSPHLHFGEIGPRQVWHRLGSQGRSSTFLRELIWREFAYHLLYHFPATTDHPLRPEFANFPWRRNARHLRAWQRGCTGIALVDAGMHELWTTAVMHNRVRMVVASFLVKNLLQKWQDGASWFWDTLVDADLANNTLNWQWVAGCGADAAPYFRIFNPVTQGERYDPDGAYVRRWVPERAKMPTKRIHEPSERAIVELGPSRKAALEAYDTMRRRKRRS